MQRSIVEVVEAMYQQTCPYGYVVFDILVDGFRNRSSVAVPRYYQSESLFDDLTTMYQYEAWKKSQGFYSFGRGMFICLMKQLLTQYDYPEVLQVMRFIHSDVIGQADYCALHGHYPPNPKQFVELHVHAPVKAMQLSKG